MYIDSDLILSCHKKSINAYTENYDIIADYDHVTYILKNHLVFSSKIFSIFYFKEKENKFSPFEIENQEHIEVKKYLTKLFKKSNLDFISSIIQSNIDYTKNKIEDIIFECPFATIENILQIKNLNRIKFLKIIKNQLYGCDNFDMNYGRALVLLSKVNIDDSDFLYKNDHSMLYTLLLAGIESVITSVKNVLLYCVENEIEKVDKQNIMNILEKSSPIILCRTPLEDIEYKNHIYKKDKKIIVITKNIPFGLGVHRCPGDILGMFQTCEIVNSILPKIKSINNIERKVGQIITYNNFDIEWKNDYNCI